MSISFDELFAIRIQLQDYNLDENNIIRRLKFNLLNSGMDQNAIDEYLVNFYSEFGIQIDLNVIHKFKLIIFFNLVIFYQI